MEHLIQYFIDLSCCWTLFLCIYGLFLQRETFFNYNRWYLLFTLLSGILLPLLRFLPDIFKLAPTDDAVYYSYIAKGTSVVAHTLSESTIFWSTYGFFITSVYIMGILLFTIFFIKAILGIRSLEKGADITVHDHYTLVQSDQVHLPFSFFRKVYISKHIDLNNDISQIMKHELAHVKGKHSLDIILIEIFKILLWFHPLIYLYKSAIRQSHEFVADHLVCQEYKKSDYGRMLINQSFLGLQMSLANHFFHSHLKKRIQMMYQNPSNKNAGIKYLIALPFLALFFIAFIAIAPDDDLITADNENLTTTADTIPYIYQTDTIIEYNPETFEEKVTVIKTKTDQKDYSAEEVFRLVEEMPSFPGCNNLPKDELEACSKQKLLEYIGNNIKYPEEARKNKTEGTVVLQFIVSKQGTIDNVKGIRDIGDGCIEEAIRVVKEMNNLPQRWKPGMIDGQAVNVLYWLPIKFKLEDDNK